MVTEYEARVMAKDVRESYGRWISQMTEWKYFITRTFRDKPVDLANVTYTQWGLKHARRALADLLNVTAAKRAVAVFEYQKWRGGVPHIHCLLDTDDELDLKAHQDDDYQRWGISRWLKYKPMGGADGYVAKYLSKEMVELYVLEAEDQITPVWSLDRVLRSRV